MRFGCQKAFAEPTRVRVDGLVFRHGAPDQAIYQRAVLPLFVAGLADSEPCCRQLADVFGRLVKASPALGNLSKVHVFVWLV